VIVGRLKPGPIGPGAYFYFGADGLQAQAEALETRIREEKTAPAEEIEGFAEALQTTLDAIRRLL